MSYNLKMHLDTEDRLIEIVSGKKYIYGKWIERNHFYPFFKTQGKDHTGSLIPLSASSTIMDNVWELK